jgi:ABC-2 type transport system ATP-binding protein
MEEAERLCDHLVVMDGGRVVAQGSLDQLYQGLAVAMRLTLVVSGQVEVAALAQATGAQEVVQLGPQLTLGLPAGPGSASGDLAAPAAAVLAHLAARGHAVSQLASARASLEDVFLALTGRQLRD